MTAAASGTPRAANAFAPQLDRLRARAGREDPQAGDAGQAAEALGEATRSPARRSGSGPCTARLTTWSAWAREGEHRDLGGGCAFGHGVSDMFEREGGGEAGQQADARERLVGAGRGDR